MDAESIILVIVVATALTFDFTNGFHDTANVVATSISTRALNPRVAVAFAAVLNFVGAFLSLEVASTIANDIVDQNAVTTTIVFAGLVGAIVWNVITWYFGLPSSSSHALVGGVVGAMVVANGVAAVHADGLAAKVLIPATPNASTGRSAAASASDRCSRAGCSRSRTARTTRRRRWASSRSR
jgi:PiT family inorganic phosphate transporter